MAQPKKNKKIIIPKKIETGLQKILALPYFALSYVIFALAVLFGTTVFWSLLGARLQAGNADQLVDPYLFASKATLHGAQFPGAHSFLLKWPIFWLTQLTGSSTTALVTLTTIVCLITVGALAFVLYRIDRRPLVFGTLCLALASVLLLIPAQPYAGGLLPVNMAMLTTRNLEYILYVLCAVLFVRSPRVRSWHFWLATMGLGILVASDKIFLVLSVGSAGIGLILYALTNNWKLVHVFVRWLICTIIAAALAFGILALINASGLTHISTQSGTSSYSLDLHPKDVALGVAYAILGVFTNFGANPAFDATELKNVPHQAWHRLLSVSGPTFIINILILLGAAIATWRLTYSVLSPKKRPTYKLDYASNMSAILLWTVPAAGIAFIFTNHYYAVDARYLTISLFAAFILVAVYLRRKIWSHEAALLIGIILCISIVLGLPAVNTTYKADKQTLADTNNRNSLISQALDNHPVQSLIGDYWRVLPTKLATNGKQNVIPFSGCTQPQGVLTSQAWQTGWQNHSFAYLLSLDQGLTGYPGCTLNQVTQIYGHPNGSLLIAGTYRQPRELLLFYDHGINKSVPTVKARTTLTSTVVPITTDQLPATTCAGPSVMNVVAHQDDDLLFMNPDLLHAIQEGYCVRTIYITAGDAGHGQFYWLNRESGSEAAYDKMDGPSKDIWIQRTVALSPHEYVTIANPKGNSKISLIFMHLPDGNIDGSGFKDSNFESLAKLASGSIHDMATVDGQSDYTSTTLVSALVSLMKAYQPAEINTQSPKNMSTTYPDHSDHLAVGQFVQHAYKQYEQEQYANVLTVPINFYIGYPIHQMPVNISAADEQLKEAVFLAYAQHDGGVCTSAQQCRNTPTYWAYLNRQYKLATP